jgi:hypothetical protein
VSFADRLKTDHRSLVLGFGVGGCLAIILGAKLWLIAAYGSSTPFWDQWDEAKDLFRPYQSGTLKLADLFAAHNEHRIFLTRVLHLAQFAVEGRWNTVGETLVNAAVHVAAIGLLVVMLSRTLDLTGTLLLACLAMLCFTPPFGWGNTLVGFQLQFYLLVLLSPLSLWVLYPSAAWTPRWWLGTLLGAASYLTIASGALTLPAFIAVAVLQIACGQRRGAKELFGILAHTILAAALIWDIPVVPPADTGAIPKTFDGWLDIATLTASWPVSKPSWSVALRVLTALAIYAPVIALAIWLLKRTAPVRDPHWFPVAIACWAALQILSMLYGRGVAVLQSRYYDVILIAPFASAAALLSLPVSGPTRRRGILVFACIWFAVITIGLGQKALGTIPDEFAWWRESVEPRTENLRNFLATGDFAAIADKPRFYIPFPSAEYLRDVASDPVVRGFLPPELTDRNAPPNKLNRYVLREGPLLIPVGLACLMLALLLAGRATTPHEEEPKPDQRPGATA